MGEWRDAFIRQAAKVDFPIFTPYYDLTQAQRDYLWHGDRDKICIDSFFKMLEENQYKIQYRVMLARYRGKTTCPACHGTRLKPESGLCEVGRTFHLPAGGPLHHGPEGLLRPFAARRARHHRGTTHPHGNQQPASVPARCRTGLSHPEPYSNTLSGGESQRINLATSLGSSLVGSLYILDEPSIGLHSRDTDRLIKVLRQLQQLGNTVVVVGT